MLSLLESFDTVSHSEQLLLRLETACAELSKKQGLKEEKAWLEAATARVATARQGVGDLLTRVLRLPELSSMREEHARTLQLAAVDAVERLHAGISFAGGTRAPLIEALYGKLKIPVLRRCDREDFERFCADFEKRLNSSYARRMFTHPSFELVGPALTQLQQAFAVWRSVFRAEPLLEIEAQALRDELDATARRLDLPCRQARLLAEAALAPIRELLQNSGLDQKPKRRAKAPTVSESEASVLDEEQNNPGLPSTEELAELAAPAELPPLPSQRVEKPRRFRSGGSLKA